MVSAFWQCAEFCIFPYSFGFFKNEKKNKTNVSINAAILKKAFFIENAKELKSRIKDSGNVKFRAVFSISVCSSIVKN